MQPVHWGVTIRSFKNFNPLTEQSQNHNPKTNSHKKAGSIEHELGEKPGLSSRKSVRTHKNNGCKTTLIFLEKIMIKASFFQNRRYKAIYSRLKLGIQENYPY